MDLNVIAASKRHNFLRVVYRIEMPATPAPPMSPISNYNASPEDRSVEALSTPIDDASPPSRRTSKFQELATHLNRSRSRNKVRGKGKTRTKYKIYRRQESLLTLLFIVPEFKSMYFIFLAGFLLFFTSIVADDFINKEDIDFSMSLVKWNFQHYNQMFTTWLYMVLYTFVIVILFHIYRHDMYIFRIIQQHPKLRRWSDHIYCGCYVLYTIPLMYYPCIWCTPFNIAGSLFVSCEQTRIILKSHAFFVETFKTKRYWERIRAEDAVNSSKKSDSVEEDDDDDEKVANDGRDALNSQQQHNGYHGDNDQKQNDDDNSLMVPRHGGGSGKKAPTVQL